MRRQLPLLFAALAITGASFAACGVTPGRPITLALTLSGFTGGTFRTSSGWEVTLTEARIVVGPVYVLAPAARTAALERARSLLLPTAFAHGGFDDYAALDVRAEWLEQTVIDMSRGSAQTYVGDLQGTAGPTEYTTLELVMPADASGPTHGHVAWAAGTATPLAGGETIAFEGGLDLPSDPLARTVESIASAFDMDASGALELTVLAGPSMPATGPSWFEEAHFDRLPAPATGTVRQLAPGTQPYLAWTLAARDAASFTTHYQPARGR